MKLRALVFQSGQRASNSHVCFLRRMDILRNKILEILAKILKNSVTSNHPSPSTFILTENPCYGEETPVNVWEHFLLEMPRADHPACQTPSNFLSYSTGNPFIFWSVSFSLRIVQKYPPKDTVVPPKVFVTDLV